jgi:hypothetical protein
MQCAPEVLGWLASAPPYVPLGQSVQAPWPAALWNVPPAQSAQPVFPLPLAPPAAAAANVPAAQLSQLCCPARSWYAPAAWQAVQAALPAFPAAGPTVPATQILQPVAPDALWSVYVPPPHFLHPAAPPASW